MQILFYIVNVSLKFTKTLFFYLFILKNSISFRNPNSFERSFSYLTQSPVHLNLNTKFSLNLFSKTDQRYLITSPLFYLNGPPHLGHAYTLVSSDVLKRFLILSGYECKLLVGTDEHGSKIKLTSSNLGYSPKQYVNLMRNHYYELYKQYDISPDIVVHTSENDHKSKVKDVFNSFVRSGFIYRGLHKGYFSPKEDLYYTESKLIDGKSPLGFEVSQVNEPAYFFKLSSWREKLIDFFKESVIKPNHSLIEVRKSLESDLNDIAISRSNCDWGIPINIMNNGETDQNETVCNETVCNETVSNETVYVWFDALLGYLTHFNSFPQLQDQELKNLKLIHVIGKDILTFHSLLWPSILMALDIQVPIKLLVHGWLLNKGEKISKSLGNVSNLEPQLSDVSRFALMSLGDFSSDFEFDSSIFDNSIKILRNKFANTFYRITSLLHNHKLDSVLPTNTDHELINKFHLYTVNITKYMESFRIDKYIQVLMEMSSEVNRFIELNQIWTMGTCELLQISWLLCTLLFYISVYLSPITPKLSNDMISRLNPQLNQNTISPSFNIFNNIQHISYYPQHLNILI
ncbi:methionyl-tRNA synthetase, putative [Theileria annulata]|uniref:methionine--tRNA ligase n=1 Tax=Theileria annulata TaxID=5874 RepID=Q4UJ57_THEAN|nr:methionyl-tRNA synthetase, putative [Theileria annulata]CAI72882.1 methionyl-tRNA synthetase, putative [Theileria annulata]|eukprot:XP_953560.1 methionyl-tRNA synthetase, putative [Theileria annulata]